MVSKGFKMRAALSAQIVFMGVGMFAGLSAFVVGSYAVVVWSVGGRAEFRRLILEEPLEKKMVQANPTTVLYRESPLSTVPKHITDKPAGDATATRTHTDF